MAGGLRTGLQALPTALIVALAAGGCSALDDVASPSPPLPTTAGGTAIVQALTEVRIVSERKAVPGYDRRCGSGRACSFGQTWTDNHNGVDGHDGCDTRNNVLRRQLEDKTFKPGTHNCVVVAGKFNDPYTGKPITFRRSEARKVQIDHVYPLAKAWDLGAAAWPAERRTDFANDVQRNLLAVDGSANASKGDDDLGDGPGEWLPLNTAYRCTYVLRYLEVARHYQLAITRADELAAQAIASSCK